MARSPGLPSTHHPDRPRSKDLKVLRRAMGFVWPYWPRVMIAMAALLVTVGATLGLGQGLRDVIDTGFAAGDEAALDRALALLVGLAIVMAAGTYARFYFMSWLGERVVADLRDAVFARVIAMHPAFFEVPDGSAPDVRFGDLFHLDGTLQARVHVYFFKHGLHSHSIDNRCQHWMILPLE